MEDAEYSHLAPFARSVALLSQEERIQRLHTDRWIGYPRAQIVLMKLEQLLTWPAKQRMPNLLIVGSTNNGKSMIIEKFRRKHQVITDTPCEHETLPVLVMQTPTEPTVKRFYSMLLRAMGSPVGKQRHIAELENLALRLMRVVGVRILIIDELHNALTGHNNVRREFLNLIRFLGNELRIPIVGVGTKEAYLAIRSDDQLENRFEPMPLPLWKENDDLYALLASFATSLPLRRPSHICHPEMARYILARSEGTIGEISRLLTAAALCAIESGEESITANVLKSADYKAPSERRRIFERELV